MIDTWDIYYAILSSRKHDSELFKEWKSKLDVDRLINDLKLILSKDRPPTYHLQGEDKEFRDQWHTAECHLKGFLLAGVGNALERFDKPKRPLVNKPKWFEEKSSKVRAGRAVEHLRSEVLEEGHDVGKYVLVMHGYFHELLLSGGKVDPETQKIMILDGLPDSFNEVRDEILFSDKTFSILELYNKLVNAQTEMRKRGGLLR
ncbi:uncharacterized protein LOC125194903 [Salvia hispanica]|uniref:uncharacterized protein LOC125194903 n=1 Tax=Salvia hispanica TaxID=49212 RepID=UPI002009C5C2|nr:uncharacterized protein LOC125194903 [Salvia hispanica]